MLEVRNLCKNYRATPALVGVSFTVGTGELFGLLGPNGAGKTTLMSIASGLLDATSGEVVLAGQRFDRRDRDQRRRIGIVPQDLAIYPQLSARENLRFFGQLYGIAGAELEQRVARILAAIALTDRADDRADTFSGGMKRRLNLGAALVHKPEVLLLDEPTTGVDPQSRNHIFAEVRRLNAAGLTVVYTSHYMEEVQALCPRVGIIDHGRLIACDRVQTLLRRMTGTIRFRASGVDEALRREIQTLNGVRAIRDNAGQIEIEADDAKATLVSAIGLLNARQIAVTELNMNEPDLEDVFLHLTGTALRD
ncbi:MAG: ABC transporter ATP-binding protein [Gemmataceae bacterium]|nr:ABC transporter ATP-binding protein [Gemmataceae bacterium]